MSYEELQAARSVITDATGRERHDIALVLGSGLGDFATGLPDARGLSYADIPGFPITKVAGHHGSLHSATVGENNVLVLAGRVHYYEGWSLDKVVFAVRTAILCGCNKIILTNAAGAVLEAMPPGDLVLIRDHINLTGENPLMGVNDERLGPRFPDMTNVYCPELRTLAHRAASGLDMRLDEGVYTWFGGPSYETPAEVAMAVRLGGHLVGMSTVPEAIAARHMGARVLGISLVTNLAAGVSPTPLAHEEVSEVGAAARPRIARLLNAILTAL